MIPSIGFIIATYALCRLVQVPLEAVLKGDKFSEVPWLIKWCILLGVSVIGIFVVGILSLVLALRVHEFSREMSKLGF